jgi:hypothetical protein
MDEAGYNMRLDENVNIATQPAFDEEDARERVVDQNMAPGLFYRWINRGFLEVTGPTISVRDMCCGGPTSLHLTSLDGTSSVFVLAHNVYPFFQEGSLILPKHHMIGSPCGMMFGLPYFQPIHYENHRIVLLKTVPGCIDALFKNNASFRSLFKNGDGRSVCIALVIWASGRYAERRGVTIVDQTFWENQNPVTEEFLLL